MAVLTLIALQRTAVADPTVPLPSADRAQLEKYLGAGVVGEPVAAAALLPADNYMPSKGASMTYRVLESDGRTRTETHNVENTTDPQFAPGWHYVADPIGSVYLQKSGDGNVVILGEQDLEQKVLSRFTPGQPLIIVGLQPGQSRQVSVQVQVSDLSDPTNITHTGSLDITYSYLGAYKVAVPAGNYEAALIRWDFKGTVGPADIQEKQFRFLAPKAGMVAMVENRHISAMLIYSDKTKLGKLLEQK